MSELTVYTQEQFRYYAAEVEDEFLHEQAAAKARLDTAKTSDEAKHAQAKLENMQASMGEKNAPVKAMRRVVRRLNEHEGVRSTIGFLSTMPSVALSGDEWDRYPYLLAVRNGVIDLKTGKLRNGHPDDMLRTACPAMWEGIDAPCPQFETFLMEIFNGDQTLVAFIQRLLGYGLIGEVIHHILMIMSGKGRNGKDTLLETVYSVLGECSGPVGNDVFIRQNENSAGRPSPQLMSLRGKRIVWASETEEGAYLNGAQVKLITGGGTLRARPLYGQEVNITVSHLPILLTNFLPRLTGIDYALAKRIYLIPFTLSFVDQPRLSFERQADPYLLRKLRTEASGILAWLVRGCLEYQRDGLNPPSVVLSATNEYMDAENVIRQFVKDCCRVGDDLTAPSGKLWSVYKTWCEEQGRKTGQQKLFKERMNAEGFEHIRGNGGARFYKGLCLPNPEELTYYPGLE